MKYKRKYKTVKNDRIENFVVNLFVSEEQIIKRRWKHFPETPNVERETRVDVGQEDERVYDISTK